MRVEVTPPRLSAVPGSPAVVTIRVLNTADIISGHRIRVLGVDPQWAVLDQDNLSLFPDSSGVAVLTVTLPKGIPAGTRTLAVEVTELTPPSEVVRAELELTVPAEPAVTVAVDPPTTGGGRHTAVSVVLDNTGNAILDVALVGRDEEGEVSFAFDPPVPTLGPGEQRIGTARLTARRPWFGSPKLRPFTIEAGPPTAPAIGFGIWAQKPRLTRGAMALVGMLAVATVFAVVIAASLSQVVNKSTADRDLALQVAQAAQNTSSAGSSAVTGTVSLLTSGKPVGGVTVELFPSANTATPLLSTATGADGGYHFAGLQAGTYKLRFRGAGFTELWYPGVLTPDAATVVTVQAAKTVPGIDIKLGGIPTTVSGQIAGGDATGATLTLEIPPTATSGPVVVTTQTIGASGAFSLANVPSPALYQLVLTKPGYAPTVQMVDLEGGQARGGLTVALHKGDGSVTGLVSGSGGPLGGATISLSDGTTTVSTVSVTTAGSVGTFNLANLPTPDALTLTAAAPGYATQTLALSLASGQQLTGVSVTLTPGVGSISGVVRTADGAPAGGVTVTASNGQTTDTTVTVSTGAIGTYTISGLVVPSTYTVTFSRSDLASQTQAVPLDATTQPNAVNVDATMLSSTATIFGTVEQVGTPDTPVGEVAVLLSSGSTSYRVTSASTPSPGAYNIGGIVPGTYTISFTRPGGLPTSSIVTLTAGQRLQYNPVLNPAASIYGRVVLASNPGQAVPGAEVRLYVTNQYPTVQTTSVLTDSQGNFVIPNVDAPQSYVLAFAYPQGAAPQETVLVTVSLGTATPVCGSQATGQLPGTVTTTPPTVPGGGPVACNPATDPVLVSTS